MELTNQFRVSVPIDVAWAVLTDLERIAPCMPGAELQQVEGDEYRGIVRVKVGPITAQYKGSAWFVEKNGDDHRAILRAEGRDTRGQGNASATVTATASPDGSGTAVSIVTELAITGKAAQFGRSIMGDVSTKMLQEFSERLEADLLSQNSEAASEADSGTIDPASSVPASSVPASSDRPSAVREIHSKPAEPVDLLGSAGPSVLKRGVPLLVAVAIAIVTWRRRRRRAARA